MGAPLVQILGVRRPLPHRCAPASPFSCTPAPGGPPRLTPPAFAPQPAPGVASELVCIYKGIPPARKMFAFSYPMPNALNFAVHSDSCFDALAAVIALGYFFGLPAVRGAALGARACAPRRASAVESLKGPPSFVLRSCTGTCSRGARRRSPARRTRRRAAPGAGAGWRGLPLLWRAEEEKSSRGRTNGGDSSRVVLSGSQ